MRRRQFLSILGSAATWPLAARGQQPERIRRIGVLMANSESDLDSPARVTAFKQGLNDFGLSVGRNVQIDYRWGNGEVEDTRAAAAELLRFAPDVIVSNATTATVALQRATLVIPIVFVGVSEPVAQGFVQSLAHPGGNITGFTNLEPTVGAKWLELLKEIAPQITRLAVMFNPKTAPNAVLFAQSVEAAARKFAVDPIVFPIHEPAEIEAAMTKLGSENCGLIFPPDTFTTARRKLIISLAAQYRSPAIYAFPYFAPEGGLISYGIDVAYQFRQAGAYIDRILHGTKPAELPVQQPTKFQLIINLKTARALGLNVPVTLLAQADEVIE